MNPSPAKSGKIIVMLVAGGIACLDDRIAASVTMWMTQHDFAELFPGGGHNVPYPDCR